MSTNYFKENVDQLKVGDLCYPQAQAECSKSWRIKSIVGKMAHLVEERVGRQEQYDLLKNLKKRRVENEK